VNATTARYDHPEHLVSTVNAARRRDQLRAESIALMNNEADRAEIRQVLADMGELRAW
jgi:hypothetical protein